MKAKLYFTPEGFKKVERELEDLLAKRKPAVSELTVARDMGDRSENAAYKSARQKLSGIDRRIFNLKMIVRNAQVVERTSNDTVEYGSKVTVMCEGQEFTYFVVGTHEADIAQNKISTYSPLGKKLFGRYINDEVTVQLPHGPKNYKITALE